MEPQPPILFSAVFQSKHRGDVCVDSGAEGNIIWVRVIDEIIASGVDVEVDKLHPHHLFDVAGSNKDGARP